MSYTPGFDRHPGSTAFGEDKVDGVFPVDYYGEVEVWRGTLQLGIQNLFNRQYIPVVRQATNIEDQY